jgi:hypothetical protein
MLVKGSRMTMAPNDGVLYLRILKTRAEEMAEIPYEKQLGFNQHVKKKKGISD